MDDRTRHRGGRAQTSQAGVAGGQRHDGRFDLVAAIYDLLVDSTGHEQAAAGQMPPEMPTDGSGVPRSLPMKAVAKDEAVVAADERLLDQRSELKLFR